MAESSEQNPLDRLLRRSTAFEAELIACFPKSGAVLAVSSPQNELVAAACTLCIEHAHVLREAFGMVAPNSGSALLRLQYEALLRGAWLMFAATPLEIEKLATELEHEAEQVAKRMPGNLDMLAQVKKMAPEGLSQPLVEFDKYSRHALNSFVHSGIHPLHRVRKGYPTQMALTVVQFSNSLMHLAYRLLAALSQSPRRMNRVTHVYFDFTDCIQIAKP